MSSLTTDLAVYAKIVFPLKSMAVRMSTVYLGVISCRNDGCYTLQDSTKLAFVGRWSGLTAGGSDIHDRKLKCCFDVG